MQKIDINPIHKNGKDPLISKADYLSRVDVGRGLVVSIARTTESTSPQWLGTIFDVEMINEEQNKNPGIREVLKTVRKKEDVGELSESNSFAKFLPRMKSGYSGSSCYIHFHCCRSKPCQHGVTQELIPMIPKKKNMWLQACN